ncbi:MAG: ACT domain-containing protein [Deltaproteobacteria bacterium]|nr:ACT domain-containing protein [Deltaproteobacteria bacterium]
MNARLVLTVIGVDRPGLVDRLSAVIAQSQGSWQKSRMARLAGQFAGIVEVDVPSDAVSSITSALRALDGLAVQVHAADPEAFGHIKDPAQPAPRTARLAFVGQDRPGLVQAISRVLAQAGVNVDELDTRTFVAPMSGVPIFEAEAAVHLPTTLTLDSLRAALEAVARDLVVDVDLTEL